MSGGLRNVGETSFIAAALLVGGVVFAGIGGWIGWSQYQAIETTEQIDGQIDSSSVDRQVTYVDDPDGGRDREVNYYARITYTYTVDGERYESSNVFPGDGTRTLSQSKAQSVVNNHPEGMQTTVYVDTSNPGETAFLLQEQELFVPGAFLFGGVFTALLGVVVAVRALLP